MRRGRDDVRDGWWGEGGGGGRRRWKLRVLECGMMMIWRLLLWGLDLLGFRGGGMGLWRVGAGYI